ncbi:dienelactone hydrolase family protein [Spirosoma pollinicola]|uniref:Uncharacterized protein n=1 Tax=Spirosoma pollinicola TaxID=2057025 RepID=A0A2K8YZW3_9BACT|nr:dienelactone hydrolase family protein [Spirosoma pollinicola]AUD03173.1 hypothetical protein CWM47_15815 [Spirosoma pollinicola]
MKKLLLLVLVCIVSKTIAQTTRLEDLCQVFHLPDGKDTTTFIIFGTKEDLQVKKPLFIFRQGSQPMPFIVLDSARYFLLAPFHFRDYKKDYHFVIIQKPGVQLIATQQFLDDYQKALTQPNPPEKFISKKYLANNYRERYVDQCDKVINYLVKQTWIDSRKVVFCGGSEGFTVGADLVGNHNKSVTHTILFSGKQGRRFEVLIQQMRERVTKKEMNPEEGQKEIEQLYSVWQDIHTYPEAIDKMYGDTYRAWYSFSQPTLPNLLKINIPLYIAYGTADEEMAPSLDMLPLEFIAAGKKNLTLKPYYDHDHQFFKLKRDSTGTVIAKEYNGDAVAKDWMEWLQKTSLK